MVAFPLRVLLYVSVAAVIMSGCGGSRGSAAGASADPRKELMEFSLEGTGRAPDARGTAAVERHEGEQIVSVELANLPPPTQFAPSLQSYVVWFVADDDKPRSMGVLTFGPEQKTAVTIATTPLERFELRITAEKGIDARRPNDIVVVERQIDARGGPP